MVFLCHFCTMTSTPIETLYAAFLASTGIVTDSRKVGNQSLYVALRGDRFDGNTFALDALRSGAVAVVVDDASLVAFDPKKILWVNNTLEALQALGARHRSFWNHPVIGLTGSNGKTTAKELFSSVLSQQFAVWNTQGNLNNHIGVPLTLLSLRPEHQIAVIEMGANHQKEIALLSELVHPSVGYITNFGKGHLEGFGGIEGVIIGKSELYVALRAQQGLALINGDDPLQWEHSNGIPHFVFALETSPVEADVRYKIVEGKNGFAAISFRGLLLQSHLAGAFQCTHLAAAAALGTYFGLTPKQIKAGIESYVPQNNRAEWRRTNKNTVLLDAYNANPSSMLASLQSAQTQESGKPHVYILGDMVELGSYAAVEHQALLDWIQAHAPTAEVMTVGPLFQACQAPKGTVQFATTDDALDFLKKNPLKDRFVLLKASRSMALERLLEAL